MPLAGLNLEIGCRPDPIVEVHDGVLFVRFFKQDTRVEESIPINVLVDGHLSVLPPECQERNTLGKVDTVFFNPWSLFDRVSAPLAETGVVINDVVADNAFHLFVSIWLMIEILLPDGVYFFLRLHGAFEVNRPDAHS